MADTKTVRIEHRRAGFDAEYILVSADPCVEFRPGQWVFVGVDGLAYPQGSPEIADSQAYIGRVPDDDG